MTRLCLLVAAAFVLALPAEAQETKPSPPPQSLFQVKPQSFSSTGERPKSVELQLKVRRKDFFERDNESFSERDSGKFVTPTHRAPKTTVLFGAAVKF